MSSNSKLSQSEEMKRHEYLKILLSAIPYGRGVKAEVSIDLKNDSITLLIYAPQEVTSTSISPLRFEMLADRIGPDLAAQVEQARKVAASAVVP